MVSHAIRRRRSRTITQTVSRTKERRYQTERSLPLSRHFREPSRTATRLLPSRLTTPVVEVPNIFTPPKAHVLSQVDAFSRMYPRERVMSGEALAKAPVAPTVNLKALYYTRPDVMVCVRRKQRREVLFALGQGGKKHRRPKYTEQSKIICR